MSTLEPLTSAQPISQANFSNFRLLPTGEILLYLKRNHVNANGWTGRYDLHFLINKSYMSGLIVPDGYGGWKNPTTGLFYLEYELRELVGDVANEEAQTAALQEDWRIPVKTWPDQGWEADEGTLSGAMTDVMEEVTRKSQMPSFRDVTDHFLGSVTTVASSASNQTSRA
ncbi:hypothetical protein FFLO_05778 [Filobasidium floriforme]|uniref:Uncharacterized protein n=1 Tax=Filobasidium floriforme TaxID=5210 RepID=A0A8K0NNM4_9TREE|nr:uncharacterized protein HD553DRAFT_322812 [Filobasidium floriforme]KAG7529137.1 hypothetical protein FFLO_05778 [Filobasidium floriforme]KAH8087306.1 hypothetical protein HD553DRAFT_322812 [Filobasidium floriforme]